MLSILTALLCEAAPIISKYKLKKVAEINAFQLYRADQISLIVSGIGRVNAAAAVGFLAALRQSKSPNAWLNVGIAGHSHQPIGAGFLVNKLYEVSSDQSWYPVVTFDHTLNSDQLRTVDQPDLSYEHQGGVDMEATAFYSTATRFNTAELIQSYKVISDNSATPAKKFSKQLVSDLIENKLEEIGFLIDVLQESKHAHDSMTNFSNTSQLMKEINQKLKLSHSQNRLINERLTKLQLLNPDLMINLSDQLSCQSFKTLISSLDELLNAQTIKF